MKKRQIGIGCLIFAMAASMFLPMQAKAADLSSYLIDRISPQYGGTISNVSVSNITAKKTATIKNWRWTVWYREKKDDAIDKTLSNGNYHGFSKEKVEAWTSYRDYILQLNNNAFPAAQNYTYPLTTTDSKIDVWVDMPGYYDILGDPYYTEVKMEGYATVTYTETYQTVSYVDSTDGADGTNSSNSQKPNWGNGGSHSGSGNNSGSNSDKESTTVVDPPKDTTSNPCLPPAWHNICDPGFSGPGNSTIITTPPENSGNVEMGCQPSNPGSPACNNHYTSTRQMITETKQVTKSVRLKIAEATLNNLYGTQLENIETLTLAIRQSNQTFNYQNKGFWPSAPSYYTDKSSTYTIQNSSSYECGFYPKSKVTSLGGNIAFNNVKVYNKDLIHAYKEVPKELVDSSGSGKTPSISPSLDTNNAGSKYQGKIPLVNFQITSFDQIQKELVDMDKFTHLTE